MKNMMEQVVMDDMGMLAMIFDGLLIVAVLGLWMAWFKQNEQQGRIESKLMQAASELQEATQMLDQALDQIGLLQTSESTAKGSDESMKISSNHDSEEVGKATTKKVSVKKVSRVDSDTQNSSQSSNGDDAQLSQILRMQREGESPETIAQNLEVPVARVKLLLMLSSPDTGK